MISITTEAFFARFFAGSLCDHDFPQDNIEQMFANGHRTRALADSFILLSPDKEYYIILLLRETVNSFCARSAFDFKIPTCQATCIDTIQNDTWETL